MKAIMIFLIMLISLSTVAFAVETAAEYSVINEAWDKIRLFFTIKAEKKTELMKNILAKRQAHYNFLVANNKTEQATRYDTSSKMITTVFQNQINQALLKSNSTFPGKV